MWRILPLLLSIGQRQNDMKGRKDAHEHAGEFKEW
jgi:hypothetical protein